MFICPGCGDEREHGGFYCLTCGAELAPAEKDGRAFARLRFALSGAFKTALTMLAIPLFIGTLYFGRDIFTAMPLVLPLVSVTPSGPASSKDLPAPTVGLPTAIGEMTESTEVVSRNYTWSYRGKWTWEMKMPVSVYDYYRSLPRPPTRDYSVYVTHPLDDPYIDVLVKKIKNAARKAGFTEAQTVQFAAAFVQSLPYTVDNVTTSFDEYPRYPVETLVDIGGDCEDTSILLAAILDEMGYGVVLINPARHLGVGVANVGNVTGSVWEFGGEKYYYIETTGNYWRIGVIPDEYKNSASLIYPLIPVPIVTHNGTFSSNGIIAQVDLEVSNLGTAPAGNVTVLVGFDTGGGILRNAEQSGSFALGPDQKSVVNLSLRVPLQEHTRIIVQILVDGILVDDSYSRWFDT